MTWEGYEEGTTYSRFAVDQRWRTNPGTGIWIRRASRRITVIAFSTEGGKANGYEDGRQRNCYLYYGMGPKGDMKATVRENKAILDHLRSGYDLVLFDEPKPGKDQIRFVGQFECYAYRWPVRAIDVNGDIRNALVFELTPLGDAHRFTAYCEEKLARYDNGGWQTIPTFSR